MNLEKLFTMQRALDERIIKEKGLEGQDLLPQKILSLQVELGELANEQRSWKFWSEDRKPRTFQKCKYCLGNGKGYFCGNAWTGKEETCFHCDGTGLDENANLLLEEYVDNLHFILSVGNDLNVSVVEVEYCLIVVKVMDITKHFITLSQLIIELWDSGSIEDKRFKWLQMFGWFVGLGEMLGFTWEQIEQEYLRKNQINHERQNNGY